MPRAQKSICDASRLGVALVPYHASEHTDTHSDTHPNHTDNPYLVDLGDSALPQQLQEQLQQLDEQQLHRLSQCQCVGACTCGVCDELNIDTGLFGIDMLMKWLRRRGAIKEKRNRTHWNEKNQARQADNRKQNFNAEQARVVNAYQYQHAQIMEEVRTFVSWYMTAIAGDKRQGFKVDPKAEDIRCKAYGTFKKAKSGTWFGHNQAWMASKDIPGLCSKAYLKLSGIEDDITQWTPEAIMRNEEKLEQVRNWYTHWKNKKVVFVCNDWVQEKNTKEVLCFNFNKINKGGGTLVYVMGDIWSTGSKVESLARMFLERSNWSARELYNWKNDPHSKWMAELIGASYAGQPPQPQYMNQYGAKPGQPPPYQYMRRPPAPQYIYPFEQPGPGGGNAPGGQGVVGGANHGQQQYAAVPGGSQQVARGNHSGNMQYPPAPQLFIRKQDPNLGPNPRIVGRNHGQQQYVQYVVHHGHQPHLQPGQHPVHPSGVYGDFEYDVPYGTPQPSPNVSVQEPKRQRNKIRWNLPPIADVD